MSLQVQVKLLVGTLDMDVEFDADQGETIAILGPNGAGKTTLIRMLAGLQPIDEGWIVLDGGVLDQCTLCASEDRFVPPEQRNAGIVFQDLALFPHLSAVQNVAFALEARGIRRRDAHMSALAKMDALGVLDKAELRPSLLSGGEAQRVALARALVHEPRMLLLDEPLSSLDASTRSDTRATLREALEGFEGVRIIVTHDLVDVIALASSVLVLEAGAITHQGSIQEVLANPSSNYVRYLASQQPNF